MKIWFLVLWIILTSPFVHANSVLIIGDSHTVGPFGKHLDQLFRNQNYTVETHGSCGSIAPWWFSGQSTTCGYWSKNKVGFEKEAKHQKTPLLPQLLSKLKPKLVVIALGNNHRYETNDQKIVSDIKKMVKLVRDTGASCIWVSGPDTRKDRELLPHLASVIEDAVEEQCRFFNSLEITQYPDKGSDGLHYWGALEPLAKDWAQVVFEFILTTLAYHEG